MVEGFLELLVPSVCAGCDRPMTRGAHRICESCALGLEPLSESGPALPPAPTPALTVWRYAGVGAELLRRFKFDDRRDALGLFAHALAERTARVTAAQVVPVPRHPTRVRETGSDPTHTLARALCAHSRRRLRSDVLFRTRPTAPQTEMSPAERQENVRDSFGARAGALEGARVLLLDDVTTTGATLREAARTLLDAARAAAVVPVALLASPLRWGLETPPGPEARRSPSADPSRLSKQAPPEL